MKDLIFDEKLIGYHNRINFEILRDAVIDSEDRLTSSENRLTSLETAQGLIQGLLTPWVFGDLDDGDIIDLGWCRVYVWRKYGVNLNSDRTRQYAFPDGFDPAKLLFNIGMMYTDAFWGEAGTYKYAIPMTKDEGADGCDYRGIGYRFDNTSELLRIRWGIWYGGNTAFNSTSSNVTRYILFSFVVN